MDSANQLQLETHIVQFPNSDTNQLPNSATNQQKNQTIKLLSPLPPAINNENDPILFKFNKNCRNLRVLVIINILFSMIVLWFTKWIQSFVFFNCLLAYYGIKTLNQS